jgi:hypothetical protein
MIRKTIFLLVLFFVLLSGCISDTGAGSGTLQFTSSPTGAQVYLDNQFRGSTPTSITGVSSGNHTLEFRYPGYESWSTVMMVSPGKNNVFAALLPLSGSTSQAAGIVTIATTSATPVHVTIQKSRDRMLIGESMVFSGKAEGTDRILLTLYGPGSYADGVSMTQQNVNGLGMWDFTWNPGSKIQSGTYTMVATDQWKTVSDRTEFTVIGGGLVSVGTSTYALAKGGNVVFSGQCTTGAQNVNLVISGPDKYSSGVDLGIIPVDANKNWNYKYSIDSSMPTGYYTVSVSDVPRTTSSTAQFTVGFA